MKRKFAQLIIVLLAGLLLISCNPAKTQRGPITLTDGLNRQVSLEAPAQKIVSLSPPVTEMLFALGAGEQVIGRDTFSDYPESAKALTDIGGGFGDYNLETIVSLAPDLVIAGSINTPELVQSLEDLRFKVYYLANPSDLEGTFTSLQTLAALSGHAQEADALVKTLGKRVDAVKAALKNISDKPAVYYELDATDPAKPYTPGPGTFYTALIETAGGINIGASLSGEWAQIGLEALLSMDPDIIILGDAMWGVTPESVAQRPGWDALTAVKEGRVLPFDDNLIARIGPRQVDGLEALARVLHPEAFK
ncbi:MAG: ABC transporter substrate-binding protein [Anaerolineaceae bacterium]|nr:ABC transporter substrate-binding protein [Anaerolineaceae bacterium]